MSQSVCRAVEYMNMQEWINQLLGTDLFKILAFVLILFIAHKVAFMDWAAKRTQMAKFTKRYGIGTVLLIIVWWLITPSGSIDDVITIYLMDQLGMKAYIMLVVALSAYLVYRMGITLHIYKD
jgi:hypothetical protein